MRDVRKMIEEACAEFPKTFGLRAFPGDVFRVDDYDSYLNDNGGITFYTHRLNEKGEWNAFAKGTKSELMAQIVLIK
jgi:hypothetical protein